MKEKVKLSNLGWIRTYWNSNEDNLLLENINDSIDEMIDFKSNGGQSLVEVTPLGPTRVTDQNKKLEEDDLYNLELESFMKLIQKKKTQERIIHTLTTGKPLLN